jgi:biotin synthase
LLKSFIDDIIEGGLFTEENIAGLLSISDAVELDYLFKKAYEIKAKYVGTCVYLRGLIELSNICGKNCYYCGIRRDNSNVKRYLMDKDEIVESAMLAWHWGYGSVVLQAGESIGDNYIDFIADVVQSIKRSSNNELGITLSLGEQTRETYRLWFNAGAHRYLLRIETSDRELYGTLHPADHSFERRLECLERLKDEGYQLGTGVMIGLPGQSMEHLARDILFFREIDADMIGMGPYIPHQDTPMADSIENFEAVKNVQMNLSLRMISAARIVLKDVNIASTTALQAIDDSGRELGLKAGANVIMPNITDTRYKKDYILYENKPCTDENANLCKDCLETRIKSIGETIGYKRMGDAPHFKRRIKNVRTG